eukprot:GFYU01045795.1.p1 GENE.GFYU01045795.1~~GFYU01045795.1.p1  ORF type:complete len:340 (-),score=58.59 GFYU01045795.1:47-1066(-)
MSKVLGDVGQRLFENIRNVMPPLCSTAYKGQAGKIGIVGGCAEYTGAPYFAAMTALRTGADLAHVFCHRDAAGPIKGYSPDIIVHPVPASAPPPPAPESSVSAAPLPVHEVEAWFPRLNVLVVGPGLGRDPTSLQWAHQLILSAMSMQLPLVIDGDGLYLLASNKELSDAVKGCQRCILTPNAMEFHRLFTSVAPEAERAKYSTPSDALQDYTAAATLSKYMRGVTIVQKGERDRISDGDLTVEVSELSSLRRCGGQGDVTAGSVATWWSWILSAQDRLPELPEVKDHSAVIGAFYGSYATRGATADAFNKHRRSMVTADVINEVGPTIAKIEQQGRLH